MHKLLVANWKMNPQTSAEAVRLAQAIDAKNVVICPPFPFLAAVGGSLKRAALGAQDAFWEERGAYTGAVSPAMLKKMGVKYVIVGHSERRRWAGETDEMVNKKMRAVTKAGLTPILCVGEPMRVRKTGLAAAKKFVAAQLRKDLRSVRGKFIVAYEPIWAIGTGRADDPKNSADMAMFIKKLARGARVLYGGSVTQKNIARIISYEETSGALVGGASLVSQEFRKIVEIANHKK